MRPYYVFQSPNTQKSDEDDDDPINNDGMFNLIQL